MNFKAGQQPINLFCLSILMAIVCLISSPSAYAQRGGARGTAGPGGGGGSCEERFKAIAGDLAKWLDQSTVTELNFQNGATPATYASAMKQFLAPTIVNGTPVSNYSIRCVGPEQRGDGYPVQVDGVPKDCVNVVHDGKLEVTCDQWKFYDSRGASKDTDLSQIRLVHHEFASGAELEPHTGSESTYFYSKQLDDLRLLLWIRPQSGSFAIKLSRIVWDRPQVSATAGCMRMVKTVYGYDDENPNPRLILSEESCKDRTSAGKTYHLTYISRRGKMVTKDAIGLPDGLRFLNDNNFRFPELGGRMQTLFGRLQGSSCKVVTFSSEGNLLDDAECPVSDL